MTHAFPKGEKFSTTQMAGGIFGETFSETVVKWQHLVHACLLPPQINHFVKEFRFSFRSVFGFVEVVKEVEKFPFVIFVWCARGVVRDCFPPIVNDASVAEHLEILGCLSGVSFGIIESRSETDPFDGLLFHSVDRFRSVNAYAIKQSRDDVRCVTKLVS